jgi:Arc/MetJ family transcription regulator
MTDTVRLPPDATRWQHTKHVFAVRTLYPYLYGILIRMKKTLHVDESLLRDARSASGAKTDTEAVRLGLEALVRHGAYERLRALRGSEPRAPRVRRRRERAASARHSA